MSNQGNVVLRPPKNSNVPELTFQTGRWSAFQMHRWLWEEFCKIDLNYHPEAGFCQAVMHHPSIDKIVRVIGNEDVPTLIFDFEKKEVCAVWITPADWVVEECLEGKRVVATMSFEDFLLRPPDNLNKHYDCE